MKVLIVGLGSIAQKHISALRSIDCNVDLVALRSDRNASSDYIGVANCYDFSEIDFSEIEFIIISNPTALHYETIKQLVQYKKPLFIEKPLFSEISTDTADLVKEITDKGILTYVACNLRFLDSLTKLQTLLIDERINEVNVYCGSYLPDWRPEADFRAIYSANIEMGGGVHIDLIHELDYVYWLFGKPNQTNSFFSNSSSLSISAFDYANYLWVYPSFVTNIVLNYYRKKPKRRIEILTEYNTFQVDLLSNTISKNEQVIFSSEQRIADTYQAQLHFFIEHVLTRKQRFNTIDEAYQILKLCIQD